MLLPLLEASKKITYPNAMDGSLRKEPQFLAILLRQPDQSLSLLRIGTDRFTKLPNDLAHPTTSPFTFGACKVEDTKNH